MNLDTFFEKFELLADAPDAVSRMRAVVLQLAVTGTLVQQDAADGLAAKYLPQATTLESSNLTRLPAQWAWVRVDETGRVDLGRQRAPQHHRGPHMRPYLRVQNVYEARIDISDVKEMNFTPREFDIFALQSGDLLLNEGQSRELVGRPAIYRGEVPGACFQNTLVRYRHREFVSPEYALVVFRAYMRTGRFQRISKQTTNIAHLSAGRFAALEFPLPPLAEQKRIVAKVDELMACCDQLEAQQQEREQKHAALSRASLARFSAEPTVSNLNLLFHKFYDIAPADLRESIHTLAIRGKLVPQDAKDGAALILLDRIAVHKAALAVNGKFRGSQNVKPMTNDEAEFELPSSWCWVRFGDIMVNRDGERIPVSKEERGTKAKTYDYYGASGVIDKIDGYLFDKPLLLIGEDGANLLNRSTPIAFIARGKYWVNNHAHVLDGISEDFLRYIELFINAISLEPYVTGSAQPKMNQAKMNSIPIALPPLGEQRRIVAKVDQLMALVDQLEQQLTASRAAGEKLLEALVAELTAA